MGNLVNTMVFWHQMRTRYLTSKWCNDPRSQGVKTQIVREYHIVTPLSIALTRTPSSICLSTGKNISRYVTRKSDSVFVTG